MRAFQSLTHSFSLPEQGAIRHWLLSNVFCAQVIFISASYFALGTFFSQVSAMCKYFLFGHTNVVPVAYFVVALAHVPIPLVIINLCLNYAFVRNAQNLERVGPDHPTEDDLMRDNGSPRPISTRMLRCHSTTHIVEFERCSATQEAGARRVQSDDECTSCSDVCPICLDAYETGDKVRTLRCGHAFHSACVDEHVTKYAGCCPMCRTIAVRCRPARRTRSASA